MRRGRGGGEPIARRDGWALRQGSNLRISDDAGSAWILHLAACAAAPGRRRTGARPPQKTGGETDGHARRGGGGEGRMKGGTGDGPSPPLRRARAPCTDRLRPLSPRPRAPQLNQPSPTRGNRGRAGRRHAPPRPPSSRSLSSSSRLRASDFLPSHPTVTLFLHRLRRRPNAPTLDSQRPLLVPAATPPITRARAPSHSAS